MDISDGLIQDCGHIAEESGVQLVVDAEAVPVSSAAASLGHEWLMRRLCGGDDYELLLTCAPERSAALQAACQAAEVPVHRIGTVRTGSGVRLLDGEDMKSSRNRAAGSISDRRPVKVRLQAGSSIGRS